MASAGTVLAVGRFLIAAVAAAFMDIEPRQSRGFFWRPTPETSAAVSRQPDSTVGAAPHGSAGIHRGAWKRAVWPLAACAPVAMGPTTYFADPGQYEYFPAASRRTP